MANDIQLVAAQRAKEEAFEAAMIARPTAFLEAADATSLGRAHGIMPTVADNIIRRVLTSRADGLPRETGSQPGQGEKVVEIVKRPGPTQ
jgi:hypothetical protein